ncbi:MAG: Pantothenate kinase, partial [uncultured Friedmanniella sp.]
ARAAGRPGVGTLRGAQPGRLGSARRVHRDEPRRRGPRAGPRPRGPDEPARRARGLRAAEPPADPLRAAHRGAAPLVQRVPRALGGPDAVRHRDRRLGRRRQVDHRPAAARAAGGLAGAPPGQPGHHRRLPAAERRARAPRADAPQGLPRVLRPAGAAPLRDGREVGQGGGRGPGLQPPRLRHRPRRAGGRAPARHRHHRGPQRAAAGPRPGRRHHRPGRQRLLRLLRLRRRRPRRRPRLVRAAVPVAARDGLPRPALLLHPLRRAERGAGRPAGRARLGHDQRPQPRAEHPAHPRPRHRDPAQGPRPPRALGPHPQGL